ncbi:WD40 repeat-containing protein [Turneriella parva DSM 21527]|uniref:WD40 repeat-containing protein n=1 Tax=Turneriella parva (strain ATCC BAA-1111 / DSM 21527 / NCTC 11395 / H) TaxID=869212 RepID=I4B3U6_TURPD|nr:WD40 repeat-containing protein [Turneriella parva DSM 21527]
MTVRSRIKYIFSVITASASFFSPVAAEDTRLMVQAADREQGYGLSYSHDHRLIITHGNHAVLIWDSAGRLVRKFAIAEGIGVMALSPVEDTLAIGQKNGPVVLYDFLGNQLRKFPKETERVSSIAYLPDGQSFAAYNGASVFIWDVATATQIRGLQAGCTGFNLLSVSPDGQWIAAGGSNGQICLYRVYDGAEIFKRNDEGNISYILFTPDSTGYITAHTGNTSSMLFFTKKIRKIGFWNLSGKEVDSVSAHDAGLSLSINHHGGGFISGSDSGYLEFWNFKGKKTSELNTQPGGSEHTSRGIRAIAVDNGTGQIVTTGWDHALRGYDIRLRPLFVNRPNYYGTATAAVDNQGKLFVFGAGKNLALFTENMSQTKRANVHHISQGPLAISSDGTRIAAATIGYGTQVADAQGNLICEMRGHTSKIAKILYLPEKSQFASIGQSGTVIFWSHDCLEMARWQAHISGNITSVAAPSNGDQIVMATDSGNFKLYSLAGKEIWAAVGRGSHPADIAFSPDGNLIAVASHSEATQIWETSSGTARSQRFGPGVATFFSNSGKDLAVGYMDGSLFIYDINGKAHKKLYPFGSTTSQLVASVNGKYLLAASDFSGIVFYDTKTYAEAARLISNENGEFVFGSADGRYDYSGTGESLMHWVVGNEAVPVAQFKEKYYTPGLLSEFLGVKQATVLKKPEISVSKRLVGKVFQIKPNGDIVIYTKVSGSLRAGKKLKTLNGANYVDATISNTLHTNVTAKAKGAVAVGNPVFE